MMFILKKRHNFHLFALRELGPCRARAFISVKWAIKLRFSLFLFIYLLYFYLYFIIIYWCIYNMMYLFIISLIKVLPCFLLAFFSFLIEARFTCNKILRSWVSLGMACQLLIRLDNCVHHPSSLMGLSNQFPPATLRSNYFLTSLSVSSFCLFFQFQ